MRFVVTEAGGLRLEGWEPAGPNPRHARQDAVGFFQAENGFLPESAFVIRAFQQDRKDEWVDVGNAHVLVIDADGARVYADYNWDDMEGASGPPLFETPHDELADMLAAWEMYVSEQLRGERD